MLYFQETSLQLLGEYIHLREHWLSTKADPNFEGNAREIAGKGGKGKGKNHLLFSRLKTGS